MLQRNGIAFILFFLFGIFITYPLFFHLKDTATGIGDELIIAWIQNWVLHALNTNPFSLFEANLYYPFHNSLAYSDLFITSSLLSFIPLQIFKEPIVVVNFTLISSLTLVGFSVYLLCFYLTKNYFASLLSGIMVIFSPAVLDKVTHLQILAIQWVPLAVLFFLIFLQKKQSKYLAISLVFFLFQTYNSFLPGYFILFCYGIIFLYSWFYKRKQTKLLITKKNIVLVLVSFALIFPIIIPYYQVSKEFNYTRDIRDAIHFAMQPEDLLYSSNKTRLNPILVSLPFNQQSQNGEFKPGYLGLVFTLLSIIVIVYFIKHFKKKDFFINSFVTISLVGLILSLGPALHLGRQTVHNPFPVPLPYALFYYILPGFQGFRNSARWEMLFVLAMAVAIALILPKLLKKYSLRTRSIIYLLLIVGCVAEFNFPMHFVQVPQKKDFPKVYTWLATTPKDTKIIELPIYNWNMWPGTQNELLREYYSTVHFRKMVNGYSGFSPPPWQELVYTTLAGFPSPKTIEQLRALGIDYVIVHKTEYDLMNKNKEKIGNKFILSGDAIMQEIKKNKKMKFIKRFGDDYVYSL